MQNQLISLNLLPHWSNQSCNFSFHLFYYYLFNQMLDPALIDEALPIFQTRRIDDQRYMDRSVV